MSAQTDIGKLIDGTGERDAIHIAIAPVTAGQNLSPGQNIMLTSGDTVMASDVAHGIVDPFLSGRVFKGDRFFMFLLPNTITSLRHNWTHPAFEEKPAVVAVDSEKWIRDFIDRSDCPSYEKIMAAIKGESVADDDDYFNITIDEEYIHVSGSDACGEIPDEFWDHVKVVTGKTFRNRPQYFSCSC